MMRIISGIAVPALVYQGWQAVALVWPLDWSLAVLVGFGFIEMFIGALCHTITGNYRSWE